MGAQSRVRTAALAVALASTMLVRGQGFFYEEPWEDCQAAQVFEELGCFEIAANQAPFKYNPSNPVPAGVDASQTYITYAKDGIVDNTVNPSSCTRACRAHGFKYASLFANGCQCGMSLSSPLDLTQATRKTGNCGDPCFGDPNDRCGDGTSARIHVDTSFQTPETLATKTDLGDYSPLGCFENPKFTTGDDIVTQSTQANPPACFDYCAAKGWSLAYMEGTSAPPSVKCFCGQDFSGGSQQVDDATDKQCRIPCSGGIDANPRVCQGKDCWGRDGVFPVYFKAD